LKQIERLWLKCIPAHPTDIFSLAAVPNAIISASGSSSLRIHATNTPEFELIQTLENAHSLGCHHLAASADGKRFVSVGFEGEVKVWGMEGGSEGPWREEGKVVGKKPCELIPLSFVKHSSNSALPSLRLSISSS
jgi:superkiller protein 8